MSGNYSFPNKEFFDGDFYIADYTNDAPPRKVEITRDEPGMFPAVHFHNPNHIVVLTANMEHNPWFCKRSNGTLSPQCECVCASFDCSCTHPWLALVELKYCQDYNIGINFDDAIYKLKKHHELLRDVKKVIINDYQNIYWVISMPPVAEMAPFGSFMFDEDARLDVHSKYDGVIVISYNDIIILDGENLEGKLIK